MERTDIEILTSGTAGSIRLKFRLCDTDILCFFLAILQKIL